MNKPLLTIATLAAASASTYAEWVKIDDFNNPTDNSVTRGEWLSQVFEETPTATNAVLEVQDDPNPIDLEGVEDGCLVVEIGLDGRNAFALDLGALGYAFENEGVDTTARTLYFEWLIPSVTDADGNTKPGFQNCVAGMMSQTAWGTDPLVHTIGEGTGPKWAEYASYLRSVNGQFDLRDGPDVAFPNPDIVEKGDQWYRFWLVHEVAKKRFQAYCQGGTFDLPTLITNEYMQEVEAGEEVRYEGDYARFRQDSTLPLNWFTIIVNIGSSIPERPDYKNTYIDNIYVDITGENITIPSEDLIGKKKKSQLINISTRGRVSAGNGAIIGGFYISGTEPIKVLIQGIGSELISDESQLTANDILKDPSIQLYSIADAAAELASNDDWGNDPQIAQAQIDTGSYPLANDSKSSAILTILRPGLYSVTLSGVNSSEGIALIEIYEVPE